MSEIDINCSYYKDVIKKESIINGIDVSKCRRRIGKSNYCRYFKSPCVDNSTCIWKKYARLQKENEELKKENTELQEKFLDLNVKSYSYYKALEEIRELIQKCEIEDISCVQCKERKRCHCDLTRLLVDKIDEVFSNERNV